METFFHSFVYFLLGLLSVYADEFGNDLPKAGLDQTTVYDYSLQFSFKPDTDCNKLKTSSNTKATLTGTLQVSTLWQDATNAHAFLLHIQPIGLASWSSDVTDLPFLLRSQEDAFGVSLTEFNEQSDKKWSGYLKAAIASSLNLAFNGTLYRQSTFTQRPWNLTNLELIQLEKEEKYQDRKLNPYEKREHQSKNEWSLAGQAGTWKAFQLTETSSMTVPWTEVPVYHIEAVTSIKQKDLMKTPDSVVALRGDTLQKTLAINSDFKEQHRYTAQSSETSLPASKNDETVERRMIRLLKHTLKSKAATINASRAFISLYEAVGSAKKEEIVAALHHSLKLKKKQQSSTYFLLDAIAADQSLAGIEAVTEVLDYQKKGHHLELFRRYVMASSFAPLAHDKAIGKLLDMMDSKKIDSGLEEALALSIGALTHTLTRKSPADSAISKTLNNMVKEKLLNGLKSCNGPETANCHIKWLRALGNLAHPDNVPLILDFVKTGGRTGPAAIGALRRNNFVTLPGDLPQQVSSTVWNVYENSSAIYDCSCKIAAVDWLMKNHLKDALNVARLIQAIPKLRGEELRTYVMAALKNGIRQVSLLREGFKLAANQNSRVTYAELGAEGQSIAYQGILSEKRLLNSTYNLGMEFAGGSMKTSAVGVSINDNNDTLPIISFGLFSRGLASFMGSSDESEASETATAGLSLEFLDISLPSVVFFNGLSELMSLALSAGGSDPVAEMQFNILIQKWKEVNLMENGLPIHTSAITALSADLSGFVEVSLWGRTFKSLVRNRAALATQLVTQLGHTGQSSKLTHSVTEVAQGKMDFVTNVDFSNFPVKLCMQMSSSPVLYRRQEKSHSWSEGTSSRRNTRSVNPAKSFYFGQRNAKYCSEMS